MGCTNSKSQAKNPAKNAEAENKKTENTKNEQAAAQAPKIQEEKTEKPTQDKRKQETNQNRSPVKKRGVNDDDDDENLTNSQVLLKHQQQTQMQQFKLHLEQQKLQQQKEQKEQQEREAQHQLEKEQLQKKIQQQNQLIEDQQKKNSLQQLQEQQQQQQQTHYFYQQQQQQQENPVSFEQRNVQAKNNNNNNEKHELNHPNNEEQDRQKKSSKEWIEQNNNNNIPSLSSQGTKRMNTEQQQQHQLQQQQYAQKMVFTEERNFTEENKDLNEQFINFDEEDIDEDEIPEEQQFQDDVHNKPHLTMNNNQIHTKIKYNNNDMGDMQFPAKNTINQGSTQNIVNNNAQTNNNNNNNQHQPFLEDIQSHQTYHYNPEDTQNRNQQGFHQDTNSEQEQYAQLINEVKTPILDLSTKLKFLRSKEEENENPFKDVMDQQTFKVEKNLTQEFEPIVKKARQPLTEQVNNNLEEQQVQQQAQQQQQQQQPQQQQNHFEFMAKSPDYYLPREEKLAQAEQYYTNNLRYYELMHAPDSPSLAMPYSNAGCFYLNSKQDYFKAETLLLRSYELAQKQQNFDPVNLALMQSIQKNLLQLYRESRQIEKEMQLRQMLQQEIPQQQRYY